MGANSSQQNFFSKNEKDLAVWRRRLDEVRNKSIAKKEHLLQL